MKNFRLFATVFSLVLLFAPTLALSVEEIRVGYLLPLTGSAARDGQLSLTGATVAVNQINAMGGILGRPIKLLPEDHKGVPAEGVNAAVKLVDRDKVHVLMSDQFSSVAFAVGESVRKMEKPVPLLTGICTSPKLTKVDNIWFFRANQNSLMEGPAFVKHWGQNLGVKKVSFLAVNDDWGRSAVEAYSKAFKEMGGEVVSVDYYLQTDSDFSHYLTKIKALKPDAIDIIARADRGARISLQFAEFGMDKMMKQLGSDGQNTDDYLRLAGKSAEGTWVMSRYEPTIPGARNERFVEEYKALLGQLPDSMSQAGYDGIYIIAEAVKRTRGTDPNKLREALEKTDYQGLASRITFDKNRQAHPDILLIQVRNGVRVIANRVSTAEMDLSK